MELKNLFLLKNNFVDYIFCDDVIEYFESNPELHSRESSYDVKNKIFDIIKNKIRIVIPEDELYSILTEYTKKIIHDYYKHLNSFNSFDVETYIKQLKFSHSFRIIKYEPGDYIHQHVDKIDFTYGSFTINLSSKNDYGGGEFVLFNGREKIKFDKGDAFIFPASYFWTHETKKITSGARYAVNCFLTNKSNNFINNFQNLNDTNIFNQPILNESFL